MKPAEALRTAMSWSGVSIAQVAEGTGATPARVSQWRTGSYNISRKAIAKLAPLLNCDEAWLSGHATPFSFYDGKSQSEELTYIVRSEAVPDNGGVLYHVYRERTREIIPVLVRGGTQFVPFCWQVVYNYPRRAENIISTDWVDTDGRPTIMQNGVPHRYPEK